MKTLLVIAGTDSSGGAGLTRDTAVATELGLQVKPVVTAVTAQTDDTFHMSHPLTPEAVAAQISAAFAKSPPDAVKIGMLGTCEIAETVADALEHYGIPIVLDPVLKASSGGSLFLGNDFRRLFSMATLLTPNLDEAAGLTNRSKALCEEDISAQAEALLKQGARAVLIKGGHGKSLFCVDHLFDATGHQIFCAPRLTHGKRGTGCSLATAISCHLASGRSLNDACQRAIQHIQRWIGTGSVDHSKKTGHPS